MPVAGSKIKVEEQEREQVLVAASRVKPLIHLVHSVLVMEEQVRQLVTVEAQL